MLLADSPVHDANSCSNAASSLDGDIAELLRSDSVDGFDDNVVQV